MIQTQFNLNPSFRYKYKYYGNSHLDMPCVITVHSQATARRVFSWLPFFAGLRFFSNRGVVISRITIKYMSFKKKILKCGRFIFADLMQNAKTVKIRRPRK